MTALTALFVGAHPDDIEIGAGGTVAKLTSDGWDVWLCHLTSEIDPAVAAIRHREARNAAEAMGVSAERVITPSFGDGGLDCNSATVGALRALVKEKSLDPDLVFTHCEEDSHNDHRAAHEITLSTFRRKCILTFPVVNSLLTSFSPHVFLDVSSSWAAKTAALREHESQGDRIDLDRIEAAGSEYGAQLNCTKGEAFGLIEQEGSSATSLQHVQALNDCPFNTFWYSTVQIQKLVLIHAVTVLRNQPDGKWPIDKDREGISLLRRAFSEMWIGRDPIQEYSCKEQAASDYLSTDNVLLSGGAVSNEVTRTYFNHLADVRYAISYTMPEYRDIHIQDRQTHARIGAEYETRRNGGRNVLHDVGILTIIRNPSRNDRWLLGCMGIHGFGSLACFEALASRVHLREINEHLLTADRGFQVLVRYNVKFGQLSVDWDSVHLV